MNAQIEIALTVTLKRRELAAVMLSSCKKDIRYYLNSICFDIDHSGEIKVVSTDGHRITALQLDQTTDTGPRQIVVRRDAIDLLKLPRKFSSSKTNDDLIVFEFAITPAHERMDDGKITTVTEISKITVRDGDITLCTKNIDAKYPDWRRVLPLDFEIIPASVNAKYLHDAQRAAELITGRKLAGELYQNGRGCSIYRVNDDCLIGIMPMRTAAEGKTHFSHTWQREAKTGDEMTKNAQTALRAAENRSVWGRVAARRYVERMGCPVYLYTLACILLAAQKGGFDK